MKDSSKSKQQLIAELTELRQQVAKLQAECLMAKQAHQEAETALAEREQQYRTLAEAINDDLGIRISAEAVLDNLLHQVRRVVSYSAANIVLLKGDTLHLVRHQGYDALTSHESAPNFNQALSDFPLDAQVVQTRQPLVIADTRQDPDWVTVSNLTWIRSFIAVPICLGEDVLGLLRLDSDLPDKFSSQDIQRLLPLAHAAAIALNAARLHDRAGRELANQVIAAETEIIQLNRKLLTLQYTGAAIASSSDLQHGLNTITKEMANLLKVEGCVIFEWDQNTNRISAMARYGLEQHWQKGWLTGFYSVADFPLIKRVLIERRPQWMTSSHRGIYPAELADMQAANLKTLLMVSMEFQDRVVGLVKLIDSRVERTFTNREIGLAQLLANQAASAIENTRLYDQVRQERNLLRTLIDNLPDYIFIKDVKGQFVINNTAHIRALGAAAQDELIGKTDFDTFPQDLAELYYANELTVLKSGQPLINQEEFAVDHAGTKRWLLTTRVPLRDKAGEITGLVGISRDITERKRAEETLWVSEKKFRTLAEMTAAAIFIFQDERIYYANSAAESITGYSRSELLKMDYWDLIHPDSNELLISSNIASPLDGMPSPRFELKFLTKNGEERWVDNTLGVIEYEGKLAVLGTAFDITTHKQIEEALQRSAANLRAIFDNTQQAFILIDRGHKIQAFNKTAREGIKLLLRKDIQVGDLVYDFVPEADLEEFNRCFGEVIDSKSISIEKNIKINDTTNWFEFNFSPVFTDDNEVIGVCCTALNIDERKRVVDALAASEERLLAEMESVLIITRALVSEINLDNLLEFIIVQAEYLTNANGAVVMLLSKDKQQLEVASPGESWLQIKAGSQIALQGSFAELAITKQQVQISNHALSDDRTASIRALLHPAKIRSLLCAPLNVQNEDLGVLLIWSQQEQDFTMHDTRLIGLFADQAALALHNVHLHARNRKLAIEQERHRLARELHDSVTQSLYSMGLAAQTSLRLLGHETDPRIRDPIEHIHLLAQNALAEMRDHLYHLHPTVLTDQGLIEALIKHCDTLSKRYSVEIEFVSIPDPPLSEQQQQAVYYIVREALWNVIKHANAFYAKVTITTERKEIVISIKDDGIGLKRTDSYQGQTLGLKNMEERARLLDATLELISEPGQGTEIIVRIPVNHEGYD